jgi:competence ComEA-like helix-hairpin-helix protein
MPKPKLSVFSIYTLFIKPQRLIICACLGFSCVFLLNCSKNQIKQELEPPNPPEISASAVNINIATVEELEKLPLVGREMARKIIEYREKYGAFRRAENLILVRGMSDKKFREIRSLVKVE